MKKLKKIAVLIAASGFSSRMQTDKPLLKTKQNHTFIESIISSYIHAGVKMCFIVTRAALAETIRTQLTPYSEKSKITIVENPMPEYGRFFSIQTGLKKIDADFIFIQNADTPRVTSQLLSAMLNVAETDSCIIPSFNNSTGHPVLISKSVAGSILKQNDSNANLKDVLKQFKQVYVTCTDASILYNINTKEDYKSYLES